MQLMYSATLANWDLMIMNRLFIIALSFSTGPHHQIHCSTIPRYHHHHHHQGMLTVQISLILSSQPSLLAITLSPQDGINIHMESMSVSFCGLAYSGVSMCRRMLLLNSPPVPSMFCSSYMGDLWDGRSVVVQQLFLSGAAFWICSEQYTAFLCNSHLVINIEYSKSILGIPVA